MPINDFLTIAGAVGANVETQVAYAADADRTAFFADGGIPDANQHGKMFRQPSAIAAMIAQAVCDITGKDMLDNGDAGAATLLANFKTMLQMSGNLNYQLAAGGVNAITIAPGAAAAYKPGESWFIVPGGTNTIAGVTINRDGIGAKTLVNPDNSALAAGAIPATGVIEVVYQAALDKWILLTTYTSILAAFTGNLAAPGWVKLPNGLVMQWMTYSLSPTTATNTPPSTKWGQVNAVAWPIVFPNDCRAVIASNQITNNGQFRLVAVQKNGGTSVDVYATCWDDPTVGLPLTGWLFGIGN